MACFKLEVACFKPERLVSGQDGLFNLMVACLRPCVACFKSKVVWF